MTWLQYRDGRFYRAHGDTVRRYRDSIHVFYRCRWRARRSARRRRGHRRQIEEDDCAGSRTCEPQACACCQSICRNPTLKLLFRFGRIVPGKRSAKSYHTLRTIAQDLQFLAQTHTIRIRNRPAKQVGGQRWLNQHSMNRGSTRQSVLCAVSASPECLMNRGELHRLRTGSPAHCSRPSGPDSTFRRVHLWILFARQIFPAADPRRASVAAVSPLTR